MALILLHLFSKLLPDFIKFGGKLLQLVVLYCIYEPGSVCVCARDETVIIGQLELPPDMYQPGL